MGGTVVVRAFELQHVTGTIAFEAFVGNGWTGNVSAQVFEFLALMGGTADLGMEAKALLVDTAHGGSGDFCVGTVCKLSTFWPARGPSAMR